MSSSTQVPYIHGNVGGMYNLADGAGSTPEIDGADGHGAATLVSQSKLRAILRNQSRRDEQRPSTSSAVQALQVATSQHAEAASSRRPSLVSSVSSLVLGTDTAGRAKREALPGTKSSSHLESSARTTPSRQANPGATLAAAGATPLQRQRSLRSYQQAHEEREEDVAHGSSLGSARLTRSRSTTGNLSNGVDLKVVILGAQGVGKTSLVHRYTSGQFSTSAVPSTIGASFLTKKLVVDGVKVRLQIWDTAGQERFRSMAPMYYRGANAAVIVYDITNPASFEDVRTWISELRQNVREDLVIHIVGSKVDLAPYERRVYLDEAQRTIANWAHDASDKEDASLQPPATNESAGTTSLFGSRRILSTSPSLFSSSTQQPQQSPPNANAPSSPVTQPAASTNRIPGLGSFAGLGGGSKIGSLSNSDADKVSNPSVGSSQGVHLDVPAAPDTNHIEVSEVSAKDNEGIEDVFLGIATRLVERREELEARALARSRQDRESVMLSEHQSPEGFASSNAHGAPAAASWCCST